MRQNTFLKRILAVMLACALMVGNVLPAFALEQSQTQAENSWITFTQVDNSNVSAGLTPSGRTEQTEESAYADDEIVRVSILLEKASTIQAGFSTMGISTDPEALSYREGLKKEQVNVVNAIECATKTELDVVWNLTLAANVISANVPYGQIAVIEKLPGVKSVSLEQQYLPNEVETSPLTPNMATSGVQTGSGLAWEAGYTGAGIRIAVIDTGTDTNHQSLNASAFEYSLSLLAEEAGMSLEAYMESLDLLDAEEIAAVADELNVTIDPESAYFSSKLPFGYNYKDADYDITHDNDDQGEHGSHVAGIATANSWLAAGDGTFGKAMDYVLMQGVAPDAQLLTMKVFGKDGSPYDSDYMAAIEDAIVLGADVVNLSLGSVAPGRTTHSNPVFEQIMDDLTESGVVVAISAGNSGAWVENAENGGYLYNTDVSMDTVGQPGSFTNSFCVASVENDGMVGYYISVGGEMIVYNENLFNDQQSFVSIAGTYEYIFLDSVGKAGDWEAVADVLPGKIAICSRGETNFAEKARLAVEAGAVAVFVYNNQSGVINLDLTEYYYTNPVAALTQAQGAAIRAVSTPVTDAAGNVLYLTGEMTVSDTIGLGQFSSQYYTLSDFSSWGVAGSLEMKPEITAPGGNIYSLNGLEPSGGGYEIMSGTSMASPQVAGMSALLAQYIQENDLEEKTGLSQRQLIQSLLMSTATPLLEAENQYYSVLQQGAGLANVYSAMMADSFITMAEGSSAGAADGKVKVELYDDPDREGVYTAAFTVHNLYDVEKVLNLNADFFIQSLISDGTNLYMDYSTMLISMNIKWMADGRDVLSPEVSGMDFNGDGKVNSDDGQALLDYAIGAANALYNESLADVDSDGDIDTHDAYTFLRTLYASSVILPADGSVEISVEFSLSQDVKDMLEQYYPNGTYLQGFLYAETAGTDGELVTSHSIPVLGFYGNWTDASMFDVGTYATYMTGEDTRIPYIGRTRGNDFKISYSWDPGYTYSFAGNPLIADSVYMPERNAVNSADSIEGVSFIAIRHADDSRVVVVNETTGQVLMDQQTGAVNMAYYYGSLGWQNSGMTLTTNFSLKSASEGDRISMDFTLVPEYYIDSQGNVDWDALGEGATIGTSFVIDNTAPELLDVSISLLNNTMTVTASDNQYIAAVGLYNKTGTRCLASTGAKQDIEAGETAEYTFSLDAVNGKKFLLQVFDYAMNATTYLIEMQIGEEADLPTMMAFDLVSRHWCGFDSTFEYDYKVGTTRVAYADHTYYAATIAEHYVFASTSKGELYVMPEDDLSDTTYITDLEMVLYDMAYNQADGEIYAVNEMGELVKFHKLTGEIHKVGQIGINTNTLACSPEGVFYCNELGTGKVYSFTLETMDTPQLLMEDPYLTATEPISGADMGGTTGNMGMEYNPNTNMICWNSHCEVLVGSYITYAYYYEIDPTTGEFTRYNDFWHEMSGLIIPVKSGADKSWADPTDEVLAVKLNKSQVDVIRNTSTQLIANVQPWTATDRSVTWTSANETIATVDASGNVTGLQPGTTTIRATSNLDPSMYAECTVNVTVLDVTIHGTLSDEEGNSLFYDWDMSADDGWVAGSALAETMTSATYSELLDVFYMMDANYDQFAMHKVDAQGNILETADNTNGIPLWDMTYNPYFSQVHGQEQVSGVYYYYLLSPKDPMALDAIGFSLGDLADYLVGITSKGYVQMEDEDGNLYDTEHLILLDNDGYVWDFWIYDVEGGMNALFSISKSNLNLEFPGDDTMDNMFTSLMVGDDGNLYLSAFDGITNEIYHMAYDEDSGQYVAVKLGDVGEKVWPATITSVTVNGTASENAASPAPMYTMAATEITAQELAAASSKAKFTLTRDELAFKNGIMAESGETLLLGENSLTSGTTYTYTVTEEGRLQLDFVVKDSEGNTIYQYAYSRGNRVKIQVNGKHLANLEGSKISVSAGDTVTVELISVDSDTYSATLTLTALEPAVKLALGENDIAMGTDYAFIATESGTLYTSIQELWSDGTYCSENDLWSTVLFKINDATVYSFDNAYEVEAGDEITVYLGSSYGNSVSAKLCLSYEGFYVHEAGSRGNPYLLAYAECPTESVEIAAGSAVWYQLSGFGTGYTLTVTGENAYVVVDDVRYDAVNGSVTVSAASSLQIGNSGPEAAVFQLSAGIEAGTSDNPKDLTEGDNTAYLGKSENFYYDFHATEDGTVTVTVSGDNWRFWFSHLTADGSYITNAEDHRSSRGDSDTVTVEIKAGESIVIKLGTLTSSWMAPGGEITVNFHFELPQAECAHPNTELRDAKPASCTENGYTGDTCCADCGQLLESGEIIEASGHSYADGACIHCGAEDPDAPKKEIVTLEVKVDVDATNGMILVSWDTANMTLVDMVFHTDYSSVLAGDGSVTIGYVALNGISAGTAVATLTFEVVDTAAAQVTVEHLQINNGESAVLMGDVNSDGIVNYLDAMLIAQYYVGAVGQEQLSLAAADVNGDGKVDYLDAMMVAQRYVGAIDEFSGQN